MIICWKGSVFKETSIHSGLFCLTIEFTNTQDQNSWLYTTVYGPNSRALKADFKREIRASASSIKLSWIICGNFNMIFYIQDRNSRILNLENLIRDLNLFKPPIRGRKFTWTNGQEAPVWVCLDRFLVILDWLT